MAEYTYLLRQCSIAPTSRVTSPVQCYSDLSFKKNQIFGKRSRLSDNVLLEGYFSKRFRGTSNELPNKTTLMQKFVQCRNFL